MRAFVRSVGSFICAVVIVVAGGSARAEDAQTGSRDSSQANSLADRLFDDGRALADLGDHEGACAKFEASLNLDPRAVGTLLHIATCKEKTGKLATAWGLYGEVAMRSRAVRADRYELAETRRRGLAPRLSTIVLRPPAKRPPGFKLTIDGLALDEAAWSSALPVDGGEHVVEATAPGFVAFRTTVRLAPEKQTLELPMPALTAAPAAGAAEERPAQVPPSPTATGSGGSSAIGMTITGVGVVTLVVGGALGIDVLVRGDSPATSCPAPCVRGSDAAAESQRRYDVLKRESLAANILVPVGAVATVVGAYLWIAATRNAALRGYVSGTNAGISGAF